MRIGVLRLTDSAPAIIAQEFGFFAEEDVPAVLSVEPSWGNIADKLAHGFLDAAVILPPLAFALTQGLRGAPCHLIVPQAVNLGGNAITLSREVVDALAPVSTSGSAAVLEWSRHFAAWVHARQDGPVRLAVVHQFSTHNLLLRYWLVAGGMDPDRDVAFTYIPPSRMVEALARGMIDGFCAGAPWGDIAAAETRAVNIVSSHGIWRNGPEKVFAVRQDFADKNAELLQAALRALLRAGQYCDDPDHAAAVAAILARPEYLAVSPQRVLTALPGAGPGERYWQQPGLRFFAHAATMPWLSHAEWYLRQMQRWGMLPAQIPVEDVAAAVYRPDLLRRAAQSLGISVPAIDSKTEGHLKSWTLEGTSAPIAMEPDGFFDL
ncbi:CmpA/NrtA family ABC transporter substrate-binding protein [Rhizomicrobium electricum]|uniref:CmpA/NrtA family ABC transporter substrate-binding protein n=1 Tax=Rhizomicrobium electricum TaxID=480070 RepID=A0ABN1ETJ2_9PROT|nr:CmpA/NrtA family ABC transporter substrate-binding protein [Rhizomicrobium electricum]NIJ49071.1 NitT/TauT family transport system ATP-binding protein/nitrate/nitrite transport system substrate-binding protein [Rhizomicrobium electricum]